jgi:alpha-tubulin suppressor-like RCC1 family protein
LALLAACAGEPVAPSNGVAVDRVSVEPADPVVGAGATAPLTAFTLSVKGDTLQRRTVTWATGDAAIATVSDLGVVTGVSAGSVAITATSEGKSATATLTVSPTPVASVGITPGDVPLTTGARATLTATAFDAGNGVLPGRVFAWTSSAPQVASVSPLGVVTGVAAGTATVTGTSEGKSASVNVTVTVAPVASVTVTPATGSVGLGEDLQLTAVLKDAGGNTLTGRGITWSSSDGSIASVNQSGLVSGRASGTATITATAEGVSGSAALSVTLRFTAVSAGRDFSCGVTPTGTAYCWGRNAGGSLGSGASANTTVPVAVQLPSGVLFDSISAGSDHACGLSRSHRVWCWGTNDFGQLGNGSVLPSATPVQASTLSGLDFAAVSAAASYTCAVSATHVAYCWGLNDSGQLGTAINLGTNNANSTPLEVVGGPFTFASATQGHACALATNGLIWCWGSNTTGQLGRGGGTDPGTSSAATILGFDQFSTLGAGVGSSCAVRLDRVALCWGDNSSGQIGVATTLTVQSSPVAVSGNHQFEQVSVGQGFACGADVAGNGWCWGANAFGQLGNGGTGQPSPPSPQAVSGTVSFAAIDAGWSHACGVSTDHRVYCWGRAQPGGLSDASALGSGGANDSHVPVAVAGQ